MVSHHIFRFFPALCLNLEHSTNPIFMIILRNVSRCFFPEFMCMPHQENVSRRTYLCIEEFEVLMVFATIWATHKSYYGPHS